MSTQIAYSLLAAIQHRASLALNTDEASAGQGSTNLLLDQLNKTDKPHPDMQFFDASSLLDRLDLDGLFSDDDPSRLRRKLENGFKEFGSLRDLGRKLLSGDPISAVREAIEELDGTGGARALPSAITGLLRRQVGIGLSYVTTLKNLVNPALPEGVIEGWKQYFFGEAGYQTVDGIQIVAPGHAGLLGSLKPAALSPDGLQQSLRGLRGLLNERSAEQYVRDLVRIVVEVAGDLRYRLPDRQKQLLGQVNDQAKAARWLKGAASMAESLVTSAVEEASLGVAQFQTNAVLAAAAATYAGTVARKASQHAFLSEAAVPV